MIVVYLFLAVEVTLAEEPDPVRCMVLIEIIESI